MQDQKPTEAQVIAQNNIQPTEPVFTPEQLAAIKSRNKIARGISWIRSIALLSLLNSMIFSFGGAVSFVIGLGVTQLASAVTTSLVPGVNGVIISVIFSILVSGLFLLLWFFAKKMHIWALVAVLVLYSLDSLIFLLLKDYLSFGFHIYAGYFIFEATRELIRQNMAVSR